ncbi:hypothetical protein PF002_g1311 [Phytophthora fragariae]|uniref:Fatty acid synthase beta subunit AflB /Fas1-like central domain-containing protein n=1 Tax=Phytophthora fragariae TaxID=53985 RepID=A0A6A3G4L5_9STRA|nr:hypothetical protein PF003_g24710 [Phytophthora fragariae]KAE8948888.1 hypothetical protein PF009_g1535 [Phytophthora fragariae]KAE9029736.1 hypothetical protein PF011_g920 [Phytophthora fragariae]KAE9257112.1 hypothetical protein PF002_g1311 [Phytophthora fragariae]
MEGKSQCWVHSTYFSRVKKLITRTEERFRRESSGALFDQSELKSNPRGMLSAFIAKCPSTVSTLLSLPDCDFFLELCRTGGKPVNFVAAITKYFKTWFKKTSVYTVVDEPVADILGGINSGFINVVKESGAISAASVAATKQVVDIAGVEKYVIDAAGIRVFDRSIDISGSVIEIEKKGTASAVVVNEVCLAVAELKVGIVSMEMTFQHHPELLLSIEDKKDDSCEAACAESMMSRVLHRHRRAFVPAQGRQSGRRRTLSQGPAGAAAPARGHALRGLQSAQRAHAREILWYQRHSEVVHFEEETSNTSASEYARGLAAEAAAGAAAAAAKAATASAPKAKAAPAEPALVAAPVVVAPVAPVQAASVPAPAAEDAPVAVLHIPRVLLSVRMNKRARKPWT